MTIPHSIPTGSHIGIDISKARLDIAVQETGQIWHCGQTSADHDKLAHLLARHKVRLVLLEATGRYGNALCTALHRAGVPVRVENPVRVRNFARSTGTATKTDLIDAKMLAKMGAVLKLAPHAQVTDTHIEMSDLAARRDQLITMRNAERARLDPEPASTLIKEQIADTVRHLEAQIKQIEARFDAIIAASERLTETRKAFEAVKGVAAATARTLLACMPELGLLNRRQVAALAGIAPITNQSGQRNAPTPIGQGRDRVRRALYMAALSASKWNAHLKPFHQRMLAAGLKPKQAIIAVARKLLIHLNSLAATQLRAHPGRA